MLVFICAYFILHQTLFCRYSGLRLWSFKQLITSAGLCIRDWKKYAGQHLYLERADAVYFFFFFWKARQSFYSNLHIPKITLGLVGNVKQKKIFFIHSLVKYMHIEIWQKSKNTFMKIIFGTKLKFSEFIMN